MNKLVTIAIASYNNGKYIERCVESVIHQTYQNLEIMIVDDGSNDDTLSRLEKYKSDKRIKIICKENGGLSSVRQMALEMAQGDYISFIDADDYLADFYVKSMLSKILQDKSNVCVCSTQFINESGDALTRETKTFLCKESKSPIYVNPQKLSNSGDTEIKQLHLSDSWNKMYDLSFLRNSGVSFCMPKGLNGTDTIFNRLLVLHSPVYSTISVKGYIHVIYSSSAVHRKKKNLFKSFLAISKKIIEECEKIGIRNQLDDYISRKLYAQFYVAYIDVFRETNGYKDALLELTNMFAMYRDFVKRHDVKEINVIKIKPSSVLIFTIMLKYLRPVVPIYVRLRENINNK